MADRRGMVRGARPGSRTGMEITRTCTYTLRKLPTRDLALSPSPIFAVAHPRTRGSLSAPYLRRSDVLGAFPCPGRRTRHHGPTGGRLSKASGSRPPLFPSLSGPQISHKASHGELTAPLPHRRPLPGPLPAPFRRPRRLSVSQKTDKAPRACERMSPEGIRLTASALSLVTPVAVLSWHPSHGVLAASRQPPGVLSAPSPSERAGRLGSSALVLYVVDSDLAWPD